MTSAPMARVRYAGYRGDGFYRAQDMGCDAFFDTVARGEDTVYYSSDVGKTSTELFEDVYPLTNQSVDKSRVNMCVGNLFACRCTPFADCGPTGCTYSQMDGNSWCNCTDAF